MCSVNDSKWKLTKRGLFQSWTKTTITMAFPVCECRLSAWKVKAFTLERLIPGVGVGMGLQTTRCSTWVVTAGTLVGLLPSVGVGMCHQTSRFTVSVLGREEGYTMKYGLSPREFPRAQPEGTPEGSGHVSSYIPTQVLIRTLSHSYQWLCSRNVIMTNK